MQDAVINKTADIQSAVLLCVKGLIEKASSRFNCAIVQPEITFRASGTRAGTAFLHQNRINFNRILLHHYPDEYLNDIVPHEVAHIVVHTLFGRVKPHGKEWQLVMLTVFGREPAVTHTLDISVLKRKTWHYRCGCSTHELTTRRHNLIKNQRREYRCQRCGERLNAI